MPREQWIKLFSDWVARLGTDHGYELGARGKSGRRITLGNNQEFHLTAEFEDDFADTRFIASDESEQHVVDEICAAARTNTDNNKFGGVVWYSTNLGEKKLVMSPHSFMADFLLRLGNQQRVLGWRRLGPNILLEFVEETPPDGEAGAARILAPASTVRVHMNVPGPIAGDFSKLIAVNNIELIASICAFALGRPVEMPMDFFATKDDQIEFLDEKMRDESISTLARKSISLDVYSRFVPFGDVTSLQRVRACLVTYYAAMCQERNAVANILYVVAAETLTTPVPAWRESKLTNRFIKFFEELISEELDVIVGHGNFEEAFNLRRGNKSARRLRLELLDTIYSQRSSLVHFGIQSTYSGFTNDFSYEEPRRGLLSDFVEAAILRFLESPRESLIGHSGIETIAEAQRQA